MFYSHAIIHNLCLFFNDSLLEIGICGNKRMDGDLELLEFELVFEVNLVLHLCVVDQDIQQVTLLVLLRIRLILLLKTLSSDNFEDFQGDLFRDDWSVFFLYSVLLWFLLRLLAHNIIQLTLQCQLEFFCAVTLCDLIMRGGEFSLCYAKGTAHFPEHLLVLGLLLNAHLLHDVGIPNPIVIFIGQAPATDSLFNIDQLALLSDHSLTVYQAKEVISVQTWSEVRIVCMDNIGEALL